MTTKAAITFSHEEASVLRADARQHSDGLPLVDYWIHWGRVATTIRLPAPDAAIAAWAELPADPKDWPRAAGATVTDPPLWAGPEARALVAQLTMDGEAHVRGYIAVGADGWAKFLGEAALVDIATLRASR